jgi:hypothetical protein
MGSVGVFDLNEGNIGEFVIGPGKSDAPFGVPGVGVDAIPASALELVVVERVKGEEILFDGMVEDDEAFLRLVEAEVAQKLQFLSGEGFAKKDLLNERARETLDHRLSVT